MKDTYIKQLTFSRGDGRCPVCRKLISLKKHFDIELHDANTRSRSVRSCQLLYCDHCDLPLVDGKVIAEIYKNTGMRPSTFSTKKDKLTGIKNQMHYQKAYTTTPLADNDKGYKIIGKSTSIWKPYTKLYPINGQSLCPKCQRPLVKDETIIPIAESSNVLLKGLVCHACKSMFIRNADDIVEMLKDNPYSTGFFLNDIAYWQYSETNEKKIREAKRRQKLKEIRAKRESQCQLKRNLLNSIESSVVLISIIFQDKTRAEYVITTNRTSDSSENVIHYSSAIGRELLTAAYVPSRKKCGELDGMHYRIDSVFLNEKIPETLIPSYITIEPNGGYSTSLTSENFEIVDLLLYSPYKDIYECVHATHDKEDDICYMDISIYRRFIKNFGNPGLWVDFPKAANARIGELNEESILKGYGYSVAKNDHLSSSERKELLAELVDLNILTVTKIAHHLDFCIQLHTDPKYQEAVIKWISDKTFIENYKVNPARFMLSHGISQ